MPSIPLSIYEPTMDTLFIRHAYKMGYESYIEEIATNYYVKQTPQQIIHQSCLEGGSTYDGRKAAVIHNTGIPSKFPIPLNPKQKLYIFPTHSPQALENTWIFFHNVHSHHKHPTDPLKSIIVFVNRKELILDISYQSLERQLYRTSFCMWRFGE